VNEVEDLDRRDALDFTWGRLCGVFIGGTVVSEWCAAPDPHRHGRACAWGCPCRVNERKWRRFE
jgi:hypothetical protein